MCSSDLTKLNTERQTVYTKHGNKLGLGASVGERDALHRESSSIFDSLVTTIKGSSEYKSAATAAEKASTDLRAVREDDKLEETKKSQRTSELSAIIRRPAELERQRIDADPKLTEARTREGEAARKVADLQAQVKKAAESDPDLANAQKAERDSAAKLASARKELEAAKKASATTHATLAAETKHLEDTQKKPAKKK